MTSRQCQDCGSDTVFDTEVGSNICTSCGTLEDPTQSVLTSHWDFAPESTRDFPLADLKSKSLRGRNGWNLAGQSKEVRENRNSIAIHQYVHSLAHSMSHPGFAPRALTIFDQAKAKDPKFRWGRQAKLLAGVSLAVAFREANQADSLRDIAYLLNEPYPALTRKFTSLARSLNISITAADPSQHLPALQSHLIYLIRPPTRPSTPEIPQTLVDIVSPIHPQIPSVIRTSSSICSLLFSSSSFTASHLSPATAPLLYLPTAPTATAILLLAIESALQRSLPNITSLAGALGSRLGVGKGVIMQRYHVLLEALVVAAEGLPWLDNGEKPGKGHAKGKTKEGGKTKATKRTLVARGLKDVLQFWEEIWGKVAEEKEKPVLDLECGSEEGETNDDEQSEASFSSISVGGSESGTLKGLGPKRPSPSCDVGPSVKKRKRVPKALEHASQFLLNPLSVPPMPRTPSGPQPASSPSDLSSAISPQPSHDLPFHLLTTMSPSLTQAPTRLQLLVAQRGGEVEIGDEDLFEEGELEGFVRGEEEIEALRRTMSFESDTVLNVGSRGESRGHAINEEGSAVGGKKRKGKQKSASGAKRLDMDKLAKLLAGSDLEEEESDGEENGDHDVDWDSALTLTDDKWESNNEGAEEVGEWRPLSPGGGNGGHDYYDDF